MGAENTTSTASSAISICIRILCLRKLTDSDKSSIRFFWFIPLMITLMLINEVITILYKMVAIDDYSFAVFSTLVSLAISTAVVVGKSLISKLVISVFSDESVTLYYFGCLTIILLLNNQFYYWVQLLANQELSFVVYIAYLVVFNFGFYFLEAVSMFRNIRIDGIFNQICSFFTYLLIYCISSVALQQFVVY